MNSTELSRDQLDQITDMIADSGLLDAEPGEIEHSLGQRLRQELLSASMQGEQLPEWARGDYGPADLAKRFLEFQANALYDEVCDPKKGKLKSKYAKLLNATSSKAATVAALAAAILAVFHVTNPQLAIPAVAAYVALWLVNANLQRWCREATDRREKPQQE